MFEKTKQEIVKLEKSLENRPKESAKIHFELAKHYLHDQDQERAFSHFLQALETCPVVDNYQASKEEQVVYDKLFKSYLRKEVIEEKVDENQLTVNLIHAAVAANKGNFEEFFTLFFKSYPSHHDHFFVYKAKAILSLRLMHFAKIQEDKEKYRKQGIAFLQSALAKNNQDTAVYKMLLTLVEEKAPILEQFVSAHVEIPRGDIISYVSEAMMIDRRDLAEKIIAQAAAFYEYSRSVTAAEEFLRSHENARK